jgi:diacylglycerol kinase family enzyme
MGEGLAEQLRDAFARAGVTADIQCVEPDRVAHAVSAAQGRTVVVGGGDGTLATAAGILAASGRRMGILPLGTRNHLARDLGLPLGLPEAVAVVTRGTARAIDLGCAQDRIFVNNCSIGLYAALVEDRDGQNLPRWLATIPAAWRVLRSAGTQHLRMEHGGVEHRVDTPLLFVGNNRYSLAAGTLGRRESLCDGKLSLAAVAPADRLGLVGMALRLVAGRADLQRDFAALAEVEAVTVFGYHRRRMALDGEVVRMRFPLRISVIKRALDVLVPPPDG